MAHILNKMESESTSENKKLDKKVVIIGAGPAGLTAAYELSKEGIPSVVLEKDSVVGGLARTVNYRGYHFDIGGHRFFTKVRVVQDMWQEVLGDDFLERKRLSRIYYNNRFFYYTRFNLEVHHIVYRRIQPGLENSSTSSVYC